MPSLDSLNALKTLIVDDKTYHYFSLPDAAKTLGDLDKLPMSLKVLLENLLRWEDEKPSPAPTSGRWRPGSRSAAPTGKSSTARPAY